MTHRRKTPIEKAAEIAKSRIFNDLDITVDIEFDDPSDDGLRRLQPVNNEPISVSRIGVMALMIESLWITVDVHFHDETRLLQIEYHFSYQHQSGGSNGHRRRFDIEIALF